MWALSPEPPDKATAVDSKTPFRYQLILSLGELELGEGRLCLLTHRKKGRDYGLEGRPRQLGLSIWDL